MSIFEEYGAFNTNKNFFNKQKQLMSHFYKPRDDIHFKAGTINRIID